MNISTPLIHYSDKPLVEPQPPVYMGDRLHCGNRDCIIGADW